MGIDRAQIDERDRSHYGRLAVGLLLASAAAFVLMPEPSWWHVGYPLDASSTTNDAPLAHPAPGVMLPFLLFAWSGLATWASVPSNRTLPWRVVAICTLVCAPFTVLLYDRGIYDSMFASGHSPTLLSLGFMAGGYSAFLVAVATLLLYVVMMARWLGPVALRVLHLEHWWGRVGFTECRFNTDANALAAAQRWADANGAKLVLNEGGKCSYELALSNYDGRMLFGLVLTIEQSGDGVHIIAGISHDWRMRLMVLGLLPAIMPLGSGGFVGVFGRRRGRRLANELLAQLGAPPIR